MTGEDTARRWAEAFGLAQAPLFEEGEASTPNNHHVLLDGGHGSFALSEGEGEDWRREGSADWAWSSNLPHHVAVTDQKVTVTRWDRGVPEVLSR